jgi:hypothetical protein
MGRNKYTPEEYQKQKKNALESQKKYRASENYKKNILPKQREKSRLYYWRNKEKRNIYTKNWWKNKIEEREKELGRIRPEHCEICGKKYKVIVYDHCHKTGKGRGWICMKCNTTLGKVDDDISLLEKMIVYLKMNK